MFGLFVVPGGVVPTLKNINPLGEVDFPLLGREGDNGSYGEPDENGYSVRTPAHGSGCLERGEEFEVSDELAAELLKSSNFELVEKKQKATPQLQNGDES